MNRFTKLSESKTFYVTGDISGKLEHEGYYGDAVNRLAKFENLYEHLLARHNAIPAELEKLRLAGKNKTVTFKELLTEKMINDMILTQLERQGLKDT